MTVERETTNNTNETILRLEERIAQTGAPLAIGLDKHPSNIFTNQKLVDQTNMFASAYKLQLAGYLANGLQGFQELEESIQYIKTHHPDIPIILDGKFNDIGDSLKYYTEFAFDYLGVDSVTANPFLGKDANAPLLEQRDKLVYFLCSTSNPGSAEFQSDLTIEIASKISSSWNTNSTAGLVVAATHPGVIAEIRANAMHLPFLMPGLGAQGANPEDFIPEAQGYALSSILVNVSRGIISADNPELAAQHYLNEIRTAPIKRIISTLNSVGAIKHGEFTLASGEKSNIYIDIRALSSSPDSLAVIAKNMSNLVDPNEYDCLATIPTGGMPITTALSMQLNKPMVYIRKDPKSYGSEQYIEGGIELSGKRVLLVDDVITNGGSKIHPIDKLRAAGAVVNHIAVVIDRREHHVDLHGAQVHSLLSINDIIS